MQDAYKDIALSLALMGVGAFGFFYIQHGPGDALQISQDAEITFRSFPSAISILLFILSVIYGMTTVASILRARSNVPNSVEGHETEETTSIAPPKYLVVRTIAVLVLLVGFAQAIGLAPLFVLAAVFLFIGFFVFGQTNWRRMAVVAVVGGGLFHGLFVLILNLPFG